MILLVTAQLVVAHSCAELSFFFLFTLYAPSGDGIYQKNGGGGGADPFNPVVSRIDTAAAATRPGGGGGSSSSLLIPICFLLASLHHNRPAQFSLFLLFHPSVVR